MFFVLCRCTGRAIARERQQATGDAFVYLQRATGPLFFGEGGSLLLVTIFFEYVILFCMSVRKGKQLENQCIYC